MDDDYRTRAIEAAKQAVSTSWSSSTSSWLVEAVDAAGEILLGARGLLGAHRWARLVRLRLDLRTGETPEETQDDPPSDAGQRVAHAMSSQSGGRYHKAFRSENRMLLRHFSILCLVVQLHPVTAQDAATPGDARFPLQTKIVPAV